MKGSLKDFYRGMGKNSFVFGKTDLILKQDWQY